MKPKPLYGTPTSTMISELAAMGMSMKCAAGILLADDGSIPRAYASDPKRRSILTKRFKQARPGALTARDFDDFASSVPILMDRLVETRRIAPEGGGERRAGATGTLLAHLAGPSSSAMLRALQNYGLEPDAYAQALDDVMAAPLPGERARAELALTLFVATGCLASPGKAVAAMNRRSRQAYGLTVARHTAIAEQAEESTDAPAGAGCVPSSGEKQGNALWQGDALCLLRIMGKGAIGYRHTLPPTERGCMVGSKPDFDGPTVSDVDPSVSPNHLRIYRKDGGWWAVGQHSARGTVLLREGGTKRIAVERPQEGGTTRIAVERPGDAVSGANASAKDASAARTPNGRESAPVELLPGDTLLLGSTVFRVLRFCPA